LITAPHDPANREPDIYPPPPPTRVRRLAATVAAAGAVLCGRLLIAIGLRHAHEGWRRTVGILLRGESTRFALSAFALRVPQPRATDDPALQLTTAEGLLSFLAGEPDAHFSLVWRHPVTLRKKIAHVDLVILSFSSDGTLESLIPLLGKDGPAAPANALCAHVHAAIVAAYNRTIGQAEAVRARRLVAALRAAIEHGDAARRQDALRYADRLLAASCLSFEEPSGVDEARFRPPAFASRRGLGHGYLSWIARTDAARGSVDLWVSAHHVGLDGVPLQDLLNRLESRWGVVEATAFPEARGGSAFHGPEPCHVPGERPVDHLITFVDLSPLVGLRKQLNARHASQTGGAITFGAVLGWLLSQEPEFSGVRIASTVDVRASSGYERDVDVVALRAADYATGEGPWGGFVEYAREFNRLIAAARRRASPVRVGMQTAGLIPAWAHATLVRADPASLDETFGTLCVTIVRDARVFVAPMTDIALRHGFFAIGSISLPTASGARVACVSIKGDAGCIAGYPQLLQRVVERAEVAARAQV
jgi:hypothetical protein